ncbi:MAG TPA: glyoxalase superfamily protein [Vicinamibacterales bacterium]|nr:glyoxalase superfamily protein [Vicinamibacterales bacterium]
MTSTAGSTIVKFTSITPNLIVRDIAKSTAFYRDVLGFDIKQTVPDAAPFVFVWLERDGVPVFLNDVTAAAHDYPNAAAMPPGGTAALFFVISGVDAYHAAVAPHANVVMPLKTQFYGMREFAITDPDGHLITFAERVGQP